MSASDIELSADLSTTLFFVGDEKTCVIVCDNVLKDLAVVRDTASSTAEFKDESKTAYPGKRAKIPDAYAAKVFPLVTSLIRDNYKLPTSARGHMDAGYFSVVTIAPEELSIQQRLPHYDNTKPYYFATTHYINEGDFGGTSFYKHRPTGFEMITADRTDRLVQSAQTFLQQSPPRPEYFDESDEHFERIGAVEYKPNRLLIYPGALFHSGIIRSPANLNADPVQGRLTANLFIDFR
jgi:hypothetical protein